MARIQGPFTPDDESMPASRSQGERESSAPTRKNRRPTEVEEILDDRFAALAEEDSDGQQFRRAQRRVPVRRGPVTKKTAARLRVVLIIFVVAGVFASIGAFLFRYGTHSWRFRIESSDFIEITGNKHVPRAQIMQVLGGDIGRNIFFVPLEERQKQIEEIPWVESAAVMRFIPNRLRVNIRERVPVAFVQIGSRVDLIDRNGVVMDLPTGGQADWSFPVITGMGSNDPLSTRAAQMKIYSRLVSELDSGGTNYSQDLNEVDLSDPEDVRVSVAQSGINIVLHLGSSNFLDRYKVFKAHLQEWLQQYPSLDSVDLRYDRQVILNPDTRTAAPPKPVTAPVKKSPPASAKKPAARARHR